MTTRDTMLAAIRAARQPGETVPPLPAVPDFAGEATIEQFTTVLQSIGGQVTELAPHACLAGVVARRYPQARAIASHLLPATVDITAQSTVAELAAVDVAVLRGEFGVAENGCVWLSEANMLHRALPTSAEHLVLVLARAQLVPTMHQAYARLAARGPGGYGLFLAGPSKTADIEQSLVIGAHGARSLWVLLD